jgi:hypothetical protein
MESRGIVIVPDAGFVVNESCGIEKCLWPLAFSIWVEQICTSLIGYVDTFVQGVSPHTEKSWTESDATQHELRKQQHIVLSIKQPLSAAQARKSEGEDLLRCLFQILTLGKFNISCWSLKGLF